MFEKAQIHDTAAAMVTDPGYQISLTSSSTVLNPPLAEK